MINFSDDSDILGKESRISKILEEVPLGIICFDSNGIIDFVNPAFSKMGMIYRLKISLLTGLNIFEREIIPGLSLTEELSDLKKGYAFEKEIKNLKITDDSEICLIIKCTPIYENRKFAGGILVLEDLKVISYAREDDLLKLESFNKITDEIADFFFIIDNEGIIKYSAGNKLNRLPSENLKDKNLTDLFPNLPPDFKDILALARLNGGKKRIIVKLNFDNEPSFYECLISSALTRQSSKFSSCTFIDITDKIKVQSLEEHLNLFKTVADVISDGIIGINAEGVITLWSPSVVSLTGFSDDETTGKYLWDYVPVLNRESFSNLKKDLQQVRLFKKEIIIRNINDVEISANASFLLGDDDNILISLISNKEIKNYDFKSIEENFRNIVTKADELIVHLDKNGIIDYANPSFISHLGYSEEEITGKSFKDFTEQEIINSIQNIEKPKNQDIVLINKRGEKNPYFANITPIQSEENTNGFNIYLIGISDKRKKEKELQVFQILFESVHEGIAIESKGRIIEANRAFAKMFGYVNGVELNEKDLLDLAAADDVLKVAEQLQLFNTNKETTPRFEYYGKRKDGSTFFSEMTLSSFDTDENNYIVIINRDVTERKKAHQVIRESEEKYRSLIENIDDFLFTLERGKLFFKPLFFTSSVKKITGYTQSEMMNDIKLLLRLIHPDDLTTVNDNLRNLIKSRTKMSSELEFRIINKQGNVIWVRNKISFVRDEKGEVQKIYGVVSDITLRRKVEEDLQKSTENLVKLNETKDRFISIISHDLRTPFSSILGFTDLLLNDDTLNDKERNEYVRYIQESSNSMLSLVNSLLDWTRLQTGRIHFEPERIEGYEIILKSINALSGAALQKNINLSSNVQEGLYVYVDDGLITQVFNNLISNAIKFTKPGGSITISASPSSQTRFYEFSVKDNGVGIRPEDAKNLFGVDTKFTTEGTAGEKGTGLGLSLVKEIIEKHGGTVRVESEPGMGSNFLFTLPIAAANILLVDSNPTDRILYSKILKHITPDYNIETVSNGKEALNKISTSTYALIITEHNMPIMGGYEFSLELKKIDMKVKPPVIVLSSSIERNIIDEYNEIGIDQVFKKPVNLSNFKQSVEKSLHQGLK